MFVVCINVQIHVTNMLDTNHYVTTSVYFIAVKAEMNTVHCHIITYRHLSLFQFTNHRNEADSTSNTTATQVNITSYQAQPKDVDLLPPPKKEDMFLVRSVCPSVCLSVGLLANL